MILFEIMLGVICGFIIGLIPNMHLNTISYIFLLVGFYNLIYSNSFFFISLAISQTITSYIPTTIFGIPTSESVMHLFPLQKLALEGRAKAGIYFCLVGSFFGGIIALFFLPFLYFLFAILFNFNIFIYGCIIFILFLFIFQEKDIKTKLVVMSIIIFSGTIGILTLKFNYFIKEPLVVCFAGLFAIPFLIESIFRNSPFVKQRVGDNIFDFKSSLIDSVLGAVGALFLIIIPSFSSSQASLFISKIKAEITPEQYLIIYSSVVMCSIIFSFFLAIYFFKPRIGYVAILLSQNIVSINLSLVYFIITIILSVGGSILLVGFTYENIIDLMSKFNVRAINMIVLGFIIFIVILISGIEVIPLLFLCAGIGFLPILFNINRIILLSYIMMPTLLFYI